MVATAISIVTVTVIVPATVITVITIIAIITKIIDYCSDNGSDRNFFKTAN